MATAVKAGQAYVALGIKDDISKGLKIAQKKLESFGAAMVSVGKKMMFAGSAATSAMLVAARTFWMFGEELTNSSGKIGITVEALQVLRFAATRSGMAMTDMDKSLIVMQKGLVEAAAGAGEAQAVLSKLGLDPSKLMILPVEKQLMAMADALQKVASHTQKIQMAQKLWGEGGVAMLNVLSEGSAGLWKMSDVMQRLNIVMGGEAAKQAAIFAQAWGDLKAQLWMVVMQVGSGVIPILQDLVEYFLPIMAATIQWIKENRVLVGILFKVAAAVAIVGGIITAVGVAIGVFIFALSSIATALGIILVPLMAVTTALLSVAAAAIKFAVMRVVFGGVGLVVRALWVAIQLLWGVIVSLYSAIGPIVMAVLRLGVSFARLAWSIGEAIVQFVIFIGRVLVPIGRLLWGITKFLVNVARAFISVGKYAIDSGVAMWRFLTKAAAGMNIFKKIFTAVVTIFWQGGALIWLVIKNIITSIGAWITAAGGIGQVYFKTINKIVIAMWGFIKTVGAAFKSLWPAIVSLAAVIEGVFFSIIEVVGTAVTSTWGVIRAVFTGMGGFFSKLWGAIKISTSSALSGMSALWTGFYNFVIGLGPKLIVGLSGAWAAIYAAIGDIGTAFVNMGGRIKDTWGGVIDAIGAGDFQLAFQIVTAGAKLVWFGFVDEMRGAWIQFNIDVVNWAQKATTSMIKIWRTASQSIAGWLADLGYDLTNFWTGQQDLLTPEERRGARDSSLNTSYDNMTGGMTDVTDPFFAEIQKILEERKKDPAAAENVKLLQAQLDALRATAKTAREEADKAAEERKTNEFKPELGVSELKAKAATMPGTFVGGTKEAAEQALKYQSETQSEAREALRKQDVLIYLTRKLVDKPVVGVVGA